MVGKGNFLLLIPSISFPSGELKKNWLLAFAVLMHLMTRLQWGLKLVVLNFCFNLWWRLSRWCRDKLSLAPHLSHRNTGPVFSSATSEIVRECLIFPGCAYRVLCSVLPLVQNLTLPSEDSQVFFGHWASKKYSLDTVTDSYHADLFVWLATETFPFTPLPSV